MLVQTAWIKNNMFDQPKMTRQLTEAELRVQRCLAKLSIPDWYLNKRSDPPKILKCTTPFESRPSSWKASTWDKKLNARAKCSVHSQVTNDTCRTPSKDLTNISSESQHRKSCPRSPTKEQKSPKTKTPVHRSKTFPTISPSHKIENINIVLPFTSKVELPEETLMFKDPCSPSKSNYSTYLVQGKSAQRENYVTSPSSMETYDMIDPSTWRTCSSKFLTFGKGNNLYSPKDVIQSQSVQSKIVESTAFLNIEKRQGEEHDTTLVENKFQRIKISDQNSTVHSSTLILRKNSTRNSPPKVKKTFALPTIRLRSNLRSTPSMRFLAATKKSTELESIVKENQSRKTGASYVQSIIRELNQKISVPSSRSEANNELVAGHSITKGQNFVKKVVSTLERTRNFGSRKIQAGDSIESEQTVASSEESYENGSSSESDGFKSAASSTSISYKESDSSSDSEKLSNYGSTEGRDDEGSTSRKRHATYVVEKIDSVKDKDDESVYWIPVPRCKLPRTSSLLSMISRLSTNDHASTPCISPISYVQTISRRGGTPAGKLIRIEESLNADSGISDRYDRSDRSDINVSPSIDYSTALEL